MLIRSHVEVSCYAAKLRDEVNGTDAHYAIHMLAADVQLIIH